MKNETIGTRVRAHREARGWTQAELAHHAMVSGSTVFAVEADRTRPTRHTLARIARALRTKVGELQGVRPAVRGDSRAA